MKFAKLKSRNGFSLLETLVSIGIMAGLTMIITPFIFQQVEEFELEKIAVSRISLQLQTERYLSDTKLKGFIEYTLNADPALKNCVTRTGLCQSVTNRSFSLYDSGNTLISGPVDTPARFDVTGAPCTTGPRCIFEVTTTYSSLCYQNAASCAEATAVFAAYEIRQNPAITSLKGPPMRPLLSGPIPIMLKESNLPQYNVTRYTSTGSLGTHQFCMLQGIGIGTCNLTGSFNQNWDLSGGSCRAAVCFDFL